MRKRFTRIFIFAIFVIGLGVGYNLFLVHFSGEGKATPEEALPDNENYQWIEGPKSEKEQRYFFLTKEGYFGTDLVTNNFKGWSSGVDISTPLPKPLEDNVINGAYSDSKILFGLIKPNGEVKVTVNKHSTKRIPLNSLSEEVEKKYNVEGYEIWYIDLAKINHPKNFLIQVLDENDSLMNELSI